MRTTRSVFVRLGATAVAAVLVASCSTGGDAGSDGPTVVVTTSMLGDVVRNVVGDAATVSVIMPAGADPHAFQPSSRDVAAIASADLVVANGSGLEGGLEDALDAAADDGVRVLEIAPLVDPLPFGGHGADDHEDESAPDHGDLDPHVWMDPIRMATAASLIANALDAIDSTGPWKANAEAYAADLEAADLEIADILNAVPVAERRIVTNHDSLGYFADRYGLSVIGVVIPGGSTLADPSSAELAALVTEMRSLGVDTIFTETSSPSVLAEAVGAELDTEVAVVALYTGSLGEPGSGADTLIGMLVTNAHRIRDALG